MARIDSIVSDAFGVLQFVKRYIPVLATESMAGIGLERDGELIAGVIVEGYTGKAVWMHVAAIPGRRWLNRRYIHTVFGYVFGQLKVDHVFGWVPAENAEARRFDEHLGFKKVTELQGAGLDGGDVLIYRLDRADCRFLDQKFMEKPHG